LTHESAAGFFFCMEQYIFIRNYKHRGEDRIFAFSKGNTLSQRNDGYYTDIGVDEEEWVKICDDIQTELAICLLKIGPGMFMEAFQSNAYMSWLKEFARDVKEGDLPLYPGLNRSPETLILYLKDVGLSTTQILRAMFNPSNAYRLYHQQAQEFGKIPLVENPYHVEPVRKEQAKKSTIGRMGDFLFGNRKHRQNKKLVKERWEQRKTNQA